MHKRINWPEVCQRLLGVGLSQKELGDKVGLSQTSVYKLKAGHVVEPSGSVGQALSQLYAAHGFGVLPELAATQQNIAQAATETVAS